TGSAPETVAVGCATLGLSDQRPRVPAQAAEQRRPLVHRGPRRSRGRPLVRCLQELPRDAPVVHRGGPGRAGAKRHAPVSFPTSEAAASARLIGVWGDLRGRVGPGDGGTELAAYR